jgi:hypothetical protein
MNTWRREVAEAHIPTKRRGNNGTPLRLTEQMEDREHDVKAFKTTLQHHRRRHFSIRSLSPAYDRDIDTRWLILQA